jgi:hypothetical protein
VDCYSVAKDFAGPVAAVIAAATGALNASDRVQSHCNSSFSSSAAASRIGIADFRLCDSGSMPLSRCVPYSSPPPESAVTIKIYVIHRLKVLLGERDDEPAAIVRVRTALAAP